MLVSLQVAAMSRNPHVLVATPGRLLELVEDGVLKLGGCGGWWCASTLFGLSEADIYQ